MKMHPKDSNTIELINVFEIDVIDSLDEWLLDNNNSINTIQVDKIIHMIGPGGGKFYNIITFTLPSQELCVMKVYGPITGKKTDWVRYSVKKFNNLSDASIEVNDCLSDRTDRSDPYSYQSLDSDEEWVKSIFNKLIKLACAANKILPKEYQDVWTINDIVKYFFKNLTLRKHDVLEMERIFGVIKTELDSVKF